MYFSRQQLVLIVVLQDGIDNLQSHGVEGAHDMSRNLAEDDGAVDDTKALRTGDLGVRVNNSTELLGNHGAGGDSVRIGTEVLLDIANPPVECSVVGQRAQHRGFPHRQVVFHLTSVLDLTGKLRSSRLTKRSSSFRNNMGCCCRAGGSVRRW